MGGRGKGRKRGEWGGEGGRGQGENWGTCVNSGEKGGERREKGRHGRIEREASEKVDGDRDGMGGR